MGTRTHTCTRMHTRVFMHTGTHTEPPVHTHPIGIRQSLAFSFSSRREEMFPGFPLSDRDMDSTLRRRVVLALVGSPREG